MFCLNRKKNSQIKYGLKKLATNGCTMYRNDRSHKGGGVAICVSEDLQGTEECDNDSSDIETLWTEVKLSNAKINLLGIFKDHCHLRQVLRLIWKATYFIL